MRLSKAMKESEFVTGPKKKTGKISVVLKYISGSSKSHINTYHINKNTNIILNTYHINKETVETEKTENGRTKIKGMKHIF